MALSDYDHTFIANASRLELRADLAATAHLRIMNTLSLIPVSLTRHLSHTVALQDFRDMALWNMLQMGLEEASNLPG